MILTLIILAGSAFLAALVALIVCHEVSMLKYATPSRTSVRYIKKHSDRLQVITGLLMLFSLAAFYAIVLFSAI